MGALQLCSVPVCTCRTKEEKTTVDDGNSKLSLELPGLPVSKVHVDYTVKSGVERLHRVLPEEAEKLQKTPFAVIQVHLYQMVLLSPPLPGSDSS